MFNKVFRLNRPKTFTYIISKDRSLWTNTIFLQMYFAIFIACIYNRGAWLLFLHMLHSKQNTGRACQRSNWQVRYSSTANRPTNRI